MPVCEFNGEKEERVRVGAEDAGQEVKVELKKVVWEDGEGFMEISAGTPISESFWITRDGLDGAVPDAGVQVLLKKVVWRSGM